MAIRWVDSNLHLFIIFTSSSSFGPQAARLTYLDLWIYPEYAVEFSSISITGIYSYLWVCKHSTTLNFMISCRYPESYTSGTDRYPPPLNIHKIEKSPFLITTFPQTSLLDFCQFFHSGDSLMDVTVTSLLPSSS